MAHPYDDDEGFRSEESRGERDRWRRESGGRPGERYLAEPEWRRAEHGRGFDRPGEWRGDEGRHREDRWGDEARYREDRWGDEYSRAPGGRDRRAARDTLEGGDLGWHGGVRGSEGGGGYGGGFFGTAYGLYAGRPERVRGERDWRGSERPTGRGPKGFRRSDERIHDEVCERIARSGIDADDVEVKVENGEVTLTGTVNQREDKWQLESICDSVFGVEDVHDQLRTSDRLRRGSNTPPTH
jgi:hypothetical protein